MKYYEFKQNNSGGRFDLDKNLCHRLIIEAYNEDEAINKAEELGCYWNGVEDGYDCECCGDRWYIHTEEINIEGYNEAGYPIKHYSSDIKSVREKYKGFSFVKEPVLIVNKKSKYSSIEASIKIENIEQYAQLMANLYGGWTNPDTRIFYYNGSVAEFV